MRKIFIFITLSMLLFFGCSDMITNANDPFGNESNIVENQSSEKSFINVKGDDSDFKGSLDEGPGNSNYSLIPLPKSILGVKLNLFVSKNIVGSTGGSLNILESYLSTSGLVTIISNLDFPAGAFSGTTNITMQASKKYAFVDCGPHMVFDKPVILNSKYIGLNLSYVSQDINDIQFSYISTNGNIYPVENEGIEVIPALGIVSVKNAKISHFSRYGWTRKR